MTASSAVLKSFDVIGNQVISGDVTHMEWCPTMDLLAVVTSGTQLMVHRPVGWQRLFTHAGFHTSITCLAWRPDGQVLAVGHADGAVTLLGVEEGELLGTHHEHTVALTSFCWVSAAECTSVTIQDSPYACLLGGLFTPLTHLPLSEGLPQHAHVLEDGTPQLDVRHNRKLTHQPGEASLCECARIPFALQPSCNGVPIKSILLVGVADGFVPTAFRSALVDGIRCIDDMRRSARSMSNLGRPLHAGPSRAMSVSRAQCRC